MRNNHLRLCKLAAIPAFLFSSYAFASGIQLDTSYSSAGYAWAGRAALYDDASTGYYNPALYSAFCHAQIGLDVIFADINPDVKLSNSNISVPSIPAVFPTVGNDRASIGGWQVLPGIYAVVPLPYRFSVGLNVNMPWGLTFDYPRSSQDRYFGQFAALQVVDIDPGISYEIIDGLSVGVGLDATYTHVETRLAVPTAPPFNSDTYVKNKDGESWAFGWNGGIFYRAPTGTHIGFGYHSKISTTANGSTSAIFGVNGAEFTGTSDSTFIYPAFFNLSIVQEIGPCWAILADVRYTNWDKVDKNTIVFHGDVTNIVPNVLLDLDWRDSVNYSLGVSFKPTDEWKLKLGFGYDETPIPNRDKRPFLIPDNNRYVGGIGAQYCINKNVHIDGGYTIKYLPEAHINSTQAVPGAIISSQGKSDTVINELTVNISWTLT